MYRDVTDYSVSAQRTLSQGLAFRILNSIRKSKLLRTLFPAAYKLFVFHVVGTSLPQFEKFKKEEFMSKLSDVGVWALHYLCNVSVYKHFVEKNKINIRAVQYQNLCDHPKEIITLMFEYCGVPLEYVEKALLAMNEDSQANSTLGRSKPKESVDVTKLHRDIEATVKFFPEIQQNPILVNTFQVASKDNDTPKKSQNTNTNKITHVDISKVKVASGNLYDVLDEEKKVKIIDRPKQKKPKTKDPTK